MNYHNITKCDLLNGEGVRVVLWTSGCEHNCKECQNPQTHSYNSGIPFDKKAKEELFLALDKDYISGITFSGGDPLALGNRETIIKLAKEVKIKYNSKKNIWLYTGYEWDKIKGIKGIENVDVIVDGKFDINKSIPSPKWCGSSNQKVLDVKKSLSENKIIEYDWE